jgi:Domain of unknown function (DUF4124)
LDYLANVIKPGEALMWPIALIRVEPCHSRARNVRAGSRLWFVVAALLLAAGPATAALYKWTDANGRVIYSDQPPTGNVKVESINAPPPPADPNAVKDLANKEMELQKKKQVRAEEDTKAAKARVDANLTREQCDRARGQMITLAQSDQMVLYTTNAQGERLAMDDAARLRELQRLDAWVRDNCKG